LTTSSHLSQAIESLEEATIHFSDAVRAGEFMHYHVKILERLDLLKRGAANVRTQLKEVNVDTGQEELFA
jgi:hypothetical protein